MEYSLHRKACLELPLCNLDMACIKNGSDLTPPTLHMRGMCYYYGTRTSIHIYIYTAPARICTPLIVSRSLRSLADNPVITITPNSHSYILRHEPHNIFVAVIDGVLERSVQKERLGCI